jgi:hypothetical protein
MTLLESLKVSLLKHLIHYYALRESIQTGDMLLCAHPGY